jgi:hypothetical protein
MAAIITTTNVPAKNDFFIVNPRKLLITMLVIHCPELEVLGVLCTASPP